MARFGIDYGTTNTVVVGHDRGRYPLVPHITDTAIGRVLRDVFPSLIVYDRDSGCLLCGAEAERSLTRPDAARTCVPLRGLKRRLSAYADGIRLPVDGLPGGLLLADVLRQFAAAVHASVRQSGVVPAAEPLEALLTWPANANGAQRHITRACFREAGFRILGTLNEPSAAAIELADRLAHGNRIEARRVQASVAVFDLGGGTFDASVVKIAGPDYSVLGSAGIAALGGDDLDDLLARLFAEKARLDFDALTPFHQTLLRLHACREKERLSGGHLKSLAFDPEDIGLSGAPCKIPVATFDARAADLLAPAVETLAGTIAAATLLDPNVTLESLTAIYLVGGCARLPLVARLLTRRFPKVRLISTDKPFSATAMGAAIRSVETVRVREVFARHFGVIRLADHGRREVFTPVFSAGLRLPAPGEAPIEKTFHYHPRHNIGHLRFLECAGVDADGQPAAGLRSWSALLFPYDPAIPPGQPLSSMDIAERNDLASTEALETYTCDADGIITVRVTRLADGQSQTAEVFQQ